MQEKGYGKRRNKSRAGPRSHQLLLQASIEKESKIFTDEEEK